MSPGHDRVTRDPRLTCILWPHIEVSRQFCQLLSSPIGFSKEVALEVTWLWAFTGRFLQGVPWNISRVPDVFQCSLPAPLAHGCGPLQEGAKAGAQDSLLVPMDENSIHCHVYWANVCHPLRYGGLGILTFHAW
jgi:hypothetical protein